MTPPGLRFVRHLGESPLSLVALVEDEQGQLFALKVLRPSVAKDKRILQRWQREGKLLQEFNHPNLVHGYQSFDLDGRPAMLLEYIEGSSLRELLQEGPLGWEQAARYGIQIARALHYLHRHGAIHRDVKPHNVLVGPNRGAVLADLGLVRSEEDPTLTRQGAALGSPAYMSPEQARDPSEVDAQADIYSLGATLFHAVAGHPPFLGKGVGEVIHRVLHEQPEEPPESVPPALRRVLHCAMEKDPERRYGRVRDLGSDLGRVLLGYPPRLFTRHRRRRLKQGLVVCLVVASLAGGFWWGWPEKMAPKVEEFASDLPVVASAAEPENPQASKPAPPAPQTVETDTYFQAWAQPYHSRFRLALEQGRLRDARSLCRSVGQSKVPKDAPLGFLELRQQWLEQAESEVAAAAERTAGQSLDFLEEQVAMAKEAVARGEFHGDAWVEQVQSLWRRAGLHVEDLPLHPGGLDPLARLQMAQVVLQQEAEQAQLRQALRAVDVVRSNAEQLLRAGSFAQARARWERMDPVVFLHSFAARTELARMEQLLALESGLKERLQQELGQKVSLQLLGGARLSGTLVKASADGFAIDYLGQAQVPVLLLKLEPSFVVPWVLGKENLGLEAQLWWCQGKLEQALALLGKVDSMAEEVRFYWRQRWQQELLAVRENEDMPSASSAPNLSAQQELMAILQDQVPQAQCRIQGEQVWMELGPFVVAGAWDLDLSAELRGWEFVGWSLSWHLDLNHPVPKSMRWLDNILFQSHGSGPAQIIVRGKSFPGYGMVRGLGSQTLDWDGEQLRLDDLPLCRWQPAVGKATKFRLLCADGLAVDSLILHWRPR